MELEILYIILCFLVIHSYILYPLILLVIKKKSTVIDMNRNYRPSVTILISAYNEEKTIRDRIENLLNLNYPKEKIQILIGSDCSTDQTNAIVSEYGEKGVLLSAFSDRRGKSSVLNDLMKTSVNEIIIFSDANTFFDTEVIYNFVRHFIDSSIGGVCGYLQLRSMKWNSGGASESIYWEFENIIKKLEGEVYTTFGATGAVYAIRRSLFKMLPMHKAIADDFYIPIRVIEQGYRIVYDKEVKSWEDTTESTIKEFQRKARIGAANFNCLTDIMHLLFPSNGFIAFGLFSHKILRWFAPFLLICIFCLNVLLRQNEFYQLLFYLQFIFFFLAFVGFVLDLFSKPIKIFSLPYYFIIANAALIVGFVRSILRLEKPAWISTR